jgi:two-component system chemotaxis sensor kinase CheA
MVSLKPVFQKMQRLVRDLAAKCDKRVNFVMEGEDTEMDRSVVEEIGDPLVHMIRNSLDHGLESPQERERSGKSAVGNLLLRAYYSGDSIVLELKDDGRGINTERVLGKAIERGLAEAGQNYSHDEILSFIFLPGFSTAEKITDVSGRGVGMDVVRTNIKKLRGRIELESEQGKGSLVRISLPLTMAIIDGMLVKVGEERFIIPVSNVNMTIKPERGQLFTVQNRGRVVKHRDEIFQLFSLAEFYGLRTAASQADEVVVMVDTEMGIYGLIVDEVLGKQEVVVKQLGGFLSNPEGVAGGAILGDGTVALIIDPSSLQARSRSR